MNVELSSTLMQDPLLADARGRQRRTLRALPDSLLANWRPPKPKGPPPSKPNVAHVEFALRRAADEVGAKLEPFFAPVRDLAYADTATFVIASHGGTLSFEPVLAALAQTRALASDQLDRLRFEQDDAARWVHLVVWADELADDGYRDSRLG